jgi:transposase-like protein
VRRWCGKFGQTYAGALRRRQSRPGDKWHLDEVFMSLRHRSMRWWSVANFVSNNGTWMQLTRSAPTSRPACSTTMNG